MTKTDDWSVFGSPTRELPGPPKRRPATPPPVVPHPSTLQVVPDVNEDVRGTASIQSAPPVDVAAADVDPQAEPDTSREQLAAAPRNKRPKAKSLTLGSNLSYKEYAAGQEAAKWVERVLNALARGGLATTARGAKLDKDLFSVQLLTADTDALMAALPEVISEFECDDLDVSLVGDEYVRLRLPTGKGNAEQKAVWVTRSHSRDPRVGD
jgi:hypothetical protein